MRAAQSVRDVGSGSRYGGSSGPGVPIEPVPEHVPDGGWLPGTSRPRDQELVGGVPVRQRIAPAVERSAREDTEPCISETEDLSPRLR
jgi:hypothetical protein